MKKAFFYLIIFLAIQVLAGAIIKVAAPAFGMTATDAPMLIAMTALFGVATIAVFGLCRWTPVNRDYMQSQPWGVLLWTGIAAFGIILPSLGLQDLLPDLSNRLEAEFNELLRSRWGYFAVALCAPVAEEMVFRGAILRSLLHALRRPWVAIVVSALLFALAHFNPAQMPHAFAIGILLGWMYWRTGSIIPGILLHWVNNSIAYVMANLLPETEHLSDLFGGDPVRTWLSVVFSLCILLPALFQLHLRMRKTGTSTDYTN